MKKMMFMVVMAMVGILAYAGEVLKDGSGYLDVPWGTTVEQVKKIYPDLKFRNDYNVGKYYVVESVAKKIAFYFTVGTLEQVQVDLTADKGNMPKVLKELNDLYGKPSGSWIYEPSYGTTKVYVWVLPKGGIIATHKVYKEGDESVPTVEYYRLGKTFEAEHDRFARTYKRLE